MRERSVADRGKGFPRIREFPMPREIKDQLMTLGYRPGSLRMYRMGRLTIHSGRESGYRYLSVSHPTRDPSWGEIKHVQNELAPGVFFCVPMPPADYWMSIAPRCYHLYEVKDERQIAMWKRTGDEARGVPEGATLEDEIRARRQGVGG